MGRLPWDDVRLFLALSRSRTLGEAGKRLAMDSSTMSRRLVRLEGALTATLFVRGRGGITATEAAERLVPVAEEMEQVMARFTGEVEAFERDISGRVRIACPADAADVLLTPHLPRLLERHPQLRVDVLAGEGVVDMARREADVALRTARPTVGDLVVTTLFPVEWRVAAAPALAEEIGALGAWDVVPWIGCTERMAGTTPGRWFSEQLGSTQPVVRSDSLMVQISAVAEGMGVALLPARSIEHCGLVPVKLSRPLRASAGPWPEDDLFLVAHRALRGVPRVRAAWDYLIEHLAARPRRR